MTLADCIAKYETVQALPINARTSGLTPLGHAVARLGNSDRAEVMALLAEESAELAPTVA